MESRYQKGSLDRFTDRLCADSLAEPLGKVDRKFVQSMLKGISVSRSLNLTEIARGLEENISLHATHKRLSRNLYDEALVENISTRLLRLGSERVGPNTRLIVHVSELHKKFARKIEFLPTAEEDSEASFKVCEIIASEPESKTYFPLLTHVWSHEVPGFISDAEEVFNSVRKVLDATANQGIVFIDNRTVSQATCDMIFADRTINYMILVEDRSMPVRVRNDCFSLEQMLDRVETRYGKILYKLVPVGILGAAQTDLDLFVHAGCSGVKIPSSGRPVNFIALRTTGAGGRAPMLYTEFQNGTNGQVGEWSLLPDPASWYCCGHRSHSHSFAWIPRTDFAKPDYYELFDMSADPWQMHNLYPTANASYKAALHKEVQKWLACKEAGCP